MRAMRGGQVLVLELALVLELVLVLALAGACSKGAAPGTQPVAAESEEAATAAPATAAPATAGAPDDAAVAAVAIDAWLESVELDVVPPPPGPLTRIGQEQTVAVGGVDITFEYATHKHLPRGGSRAEWRFKLVRDGKDERFEVDSADDKVEAEVAVHGVAFAFRRLDYRAFEIALIAAVAPAPLDVDACSERIEAAAARAGLERSSSSSRGVRNGIVEYSQANWRGHCGTLSQRVWFTRKLPKD